MNRYVIIAYKPTTPETKIIRSFKEFDEADEFAKNFKYNEIDNWGIESLELQDLENGTILKRYRRK